MRCFVKRIGHAINRLDHIACNECIDVSQPAVVSNATIIQPQAAPVVPAENLPVPAEAETSSKKDSAEFVHELHTKLDILQTKNEQLEAQLTASNDKASQKDELLLQAKEELYRTKNEIRNLNDDLEGWKSELARLDRKFRTNQESGAKLLDELERDMEAVFDDETSYSDRMELMPPTR